MEVWGGVGMELQGCVVMGDGWRRQLGTAGLSLQGQRSTEAAAGSERRSTS